MAVMTPLTTWPPVGFLTATAGATVSTPVKSEIDAEREVAFREAVTVAV